MGDTAAARKSYQDFLSLWEDADPDIPVYGQAKAEHAKLRYAVPRSVAESRSPIRYSFFHLRPGHPSSDRGGSNESS